MYLYCQSRWVFTHTGLRVPAKPGYPGARFGPGFNSQTNCLGSRHLVRPTVTVWVRLCDWPVFEFTVLWCFS